MRNRCHVCERPRDPEDDYLVTLRNGIYFPACFRCWFMWPDRHKVFSEVGYGRWPDSAPKRSHITIEDLADLLRGPA